MVKEGEPNIVDIESTGIECESDPRNEPVTGGKRAKNVLKPVAGTSSFEGSDDGDDSSNSNQNSLKTSDEDDDYDDIESLVNSKYEGDKGDHMPLLGKTQMKEKHKTRTTKKPPRPRKGPSLNTSDLQLVREISELVMKKRARVERLKAMKKMRTVRSSSSSLALSSSSSSPSSLSLSKSSLFAMMVTILFFIIILFQGFGSSQQQLEPVV
ncbi:hypothetical protein L6452_37956 [Arctium lappa]|uniref:Uncharacterized protein n=1 Tax=Arctium lappa TaxID=4217 RepID=A0ACB8Y4H3_ARCLA|nr:hypothetical protein L6452_37956 [Arctium lappa]